MSWCRTCQSAWWYRPTNLCRNYFTINELISFFSGKKKKSPLFLRCPRQKFMTGQYHFWPFTTSHPDISPNNTQYSHQSHRYRGMQLHKKSLWNWREDKRQNMQTQRKRGEQQSVKETVKCMRQIEGKNKTKTRHWEVSNKYTGSSKNTGTLSAKQ